MSKSTSQINRFQKVEDGKKGNRKLVTTVVPRQIQKAGSAMTFKNQDSVRK